MLFERDSWQEIFATIQKNKLRTFLTAFGVFWGIFMLVIMLGTGKGLQNGVMSDFGGTVTNSFFVWAQKTSKPYKGLKPGRQYNFNNEDVKALRDQLPELDVIAPMNQLGGYESTNNVVRELKNGIFGVYGIYPVTGIIESVKIKAGRFINDNDIRDRRKVCVIGQRVFELLFKKNENPIGQYIRISGVYFEVVGWMKPKGSGQDGKEKMETVYTPFSTFQTAFNYGNKVGWLAITAKPNISASTAESKAIALLKERHKIAPEDKQAVGHWNMEVEFNKVKGLFVGINALVWFVGIGTLIAGVIGVSNIMLIIVKERTREIGVKRALGATPANIVAQLVTESIFLTTLAGYFGLVFGILILELVNQGTKGSDTGMFKNPEVSLQVALIALGILIVSGSIAGLIPAQRAISLSPVDALRSE